jgi:hypothetical protein
MTASVLHLRPRKPVRRQGALPAQAPYPFTTADRLPQWLADLEDLCARRGLPSEVTARMTDAGVAAVPGASGR